MGKYFGTDGIRGIAGRELTPEIAFKIGKSVACVLKKGAEYRPCVFIGKDTRISSDLLEAALTAGLCSMGADVESLGVLPTPAVAFMTIRKKADAGIVISASHNPFEHNGIKIFDSNGYKLNDMLEEKIESMIDGEITEEPAVGDKIGRVKKNASASADLYIDYLCSFANKEIKGMKIAVDCANGASSYTAGKLFEKLGVCADIYNCEPNGVNINFNCGSTCMETLSNIVKRGKYDCGLAFDGDADRCLAVDEKGNVLNGDIIMALCAKHMKDEGRLEKSSIVATVLSNMGLIKFAEERGISVQTSSVGDRFVLEKMLEGGYKLGGEQSGHIIFGDIATTGDGQLTGIQLLNTIQGAGVQCSVLAADVPVYPQATINCRVPNSIKKKIVTLDVVAAAIDREQKEFGADGRILVRPSGTEAIVRVMAEGKEKNKVIAAAQNIADVISEYINQNGIC